ncbi:MAG TPA: SpoIID/LytB domain-containing protein [Acidimicrobiales bacterium]|nr:SpoIID/LytB domain-containing protein [Acidimicrobiales bacterium]
MPRRSLGAFAAVVASLAGLTAVPALAEPGPVLVIEGKGFGHGVGMAQDGAFSMASGGASAAAILSHFYPGTAIARRTATVRVGVHESSGPVVVMLAAGGEVRDAPSGAQSPGFPVTVSPGGSVALAFEGGKYKATPVSGAAINRVAPPVTAAPAPPPAATAAPPTTAPATPPTTGLLDPLLQALAPTTVPPTTAAPAAGAAAANTVPASQKDAFSGRALWVVPKGDSTVSLPAIGRSYRGTIAAGAAGAGLSLTNEVDVEQYLRGMGEMPASWPAAALQAQAIAARTFAIRAAASGKALCADQRCQVYIGAGNEHPATSAAATATRGQVLTYEGALAEAVYSASGGGISATPEEGFGPGSPGIPYLKPVTYPVGDPQLWAMTLPVQQVGARFGYRGDVTAIRVARVGPSGRPLEISFEGSNGQMTVDGHRFWAELQLRSTLFSLRIEGPAPVTEGEPLATSVGDGPATSPAQDLPVASAIGPRLAAESLGRAPWVGLAVLLMAAWGTAANRMSARRLPATPTTTGAKTDKAKSDKASD